MYINDKFMFLIDAPFQTAYLSPDPFYYEWLVYEMLNLIKYHQLIQDLVYQHLKRTEPF